ncbi:hypothetical protein PPYR_02624 [Photinus pyralis]|uniref:DUF19 domain-containing protein n=1 Tax=Photinus pyralis TaxID=7054 RepID=A0A1Y1NII8_PHOPY|nr:uncharacterized protein LOC116158749 [Photinus pyralis]KAB0805654.1 hypothetical protein PPYR_02624 [Photinus pyralis]
MIWIFIIVLLFANTRAIEYSEENLKVWSLGINFSKSFKAKCFKYMQHKEFEKTLEPFVDVPRCFATQYLTPNGICENYEKESCLKEPLYSIKRCLDSDEHYFPDFVLDGVRRALKGACKDGDFVERFKRIRCNTPTVDFLCLTVVKCLPQLKIIANVDKMLLFFNKQDVCIDIRTYRDVLMETMNERCNVSIDDKIWVLTIFEDLTEECENVPELDNTIDDFYA